MTRFGTLARTTALAISGASAGEEAERFDPDEHAEASPTDPANAVGDPMAAERMDPEVR